MEKKPSPLIEKPTSATAAPRPTTAALLRARLAEPGGVSMTELMLLTGWQAHIIAGEMLPAPDPVLIRTLAQSHGWAKSLRARTMLTDIAAATGHSEPYIGSRIALAFLAPKLQSAILDGRQPADISVPRLLRDGIAINWSEQAQLFGWD